MSKGIKNRIIRIGSAAAVLFLGLLLEKVTKSPAAVYVSLYFAAYFASGYDVIVKAAKNIKSGSFMDENFLMCIATIGALIIGDYSEAVAVMVFYQVGELFSDIAVMRSRKSLKSLLDLHPDYANLLAVGEVKKVRPEEVLIDDIILVKPGERIPLDGVITEGSSSIDVSAVLGESIPESAVAGDSVTAGCIAKDGTLKIKVTKEYKDSAVAKIIALGQMASMRKSKQESLVTRFARVYTPIVVALAAAVAIIPPVFGLEFGEWFHRALMFLVVSCPCALVVSVPLSFFCGTGAASKEGILVKGSNALENLSEIDTVCFDKTGTLTDGKFRVLDAVSPIMEKQEFLSLAAAIEKDSTHPIGVSIAQSADCGGKEISGHKNFAGKGVSTVVDGEVYYAGTKRWFDELNIPCPDTEGIHIGKKSQYIGTVTIGDMVKPDAKDTMKKLHTMGIKNTVMLTGASDSSAKTVAEELGMDFHNKLLPEQKLEILESYMEKGKKVGYVGDGINDVPVLSRADVGISMGICGSDAAVEASDCVIMNDSISGIIKAVKIGRRTTLVAKVNIIFSLLIKIGILILSVLGIGNMWTAVFADVGVCVLAVLNATSILKTKF